MNSMMQGPRRGPTKTKKIKLPEGACRYGYTGEQVREIMGQRLAEFREWMAGQTVMLCDARSYNYETKQYEPSECSEPHGVVTYGCDIRAFLEGGRPLD